MTRDLHHPDGSLSGRAGPVSLTPDDAGWTYTGLDVLALEAGVGTDIGSGDRELCLLPLSAQGVTVEVGDQTFTLEGRSSVFARVTDFLYLGRESAASIVSETGGELAVASSRCEAWLPPRYGAAEDVAVEIRGGGQATRQVTNFMSPEAWDHADNLMCVEVYTPDGNWSSYPPHKHDDSPECEVNNEEIYYFRIGDTGTADYSTVGFGLHRTYTTDGEIDQNVAVRDGDVFLIPRGYHGPCIAAPGYDMYYLNVMAGPGGERSMAFCDDPDHHWIRDTWTDDDVDPRCPLVKADGKVASLHRA
jgi:5-deoxy-glucuronate isomerase